MSDRARDREDRERQKETERGQSEDRERQSEDRDRHSDIERESYRPVAQITRGRPIRPPEARICPHKPNIMRTVSS